MLLPTAIGLFALVLRLHGLGDKPFWFDEVATLHRVTTTVPDLVANSFSSNHYPSYFLMLWLVAKLGTSQWLLRLPSAIFGALAASIATAIGRRLAGARSGAVAGLLIALSPFEVQFGQEARGYTLASCLILAALWGLVRLAQEPAAASVACWRNDALRRAWLAYGLGTAAALDVLNVAVPWFLAAQFAAVAIAGTARAKKCAFWRNWAGVQLAILVVWLPMLIGVCVVRGRALAEGVGWASPVTAETIWSIVAPVYLLRIANFMRPGTAPAVIPVLSLVVVALAAAGAWRLRRNPVVLAVLGCATLVLPLALSLASLFVPLMVPRYFAWGAGPFFILAGVGFADVSGLRYAALAAPLTAMCLLNLAPYYGYETKPRWDLAAKELAGKAQPGDMVLVNGYYAYWVLSAFIKGAGSVSSRIKLTWERSEVVPPAPGHSLWVVYGSTGQAVGQTVGAFQESLSFLGAPTETTRLGRYVLIWRYAARVSDNPGMQTTVAACAVEGRDQPLSSLCSAAAMLARADEVIE